MAKSMRVVSRVWAAARKCHARRPKKLLCSTTDVSILAALTAYFENKTRYSRISPARNGTAAMAGAAAAGALGRGLVRLDFCARIMEAHAKIAPSTAAARINRACIVFARSIRSRWGSKAGAPLSLRACEPGDHDIVRGHAIVKGTKKTAWKPVKSRQRFLTEMKSSRVSGPGLPAIGFCLEPNSSWRGASGCAI